MPTTTLAAILAAARQESGTVNSNFVEDAGELDNVAVDAKNELYDLLVATGETYYENTFDFTLAGGVGGYRQALAAVTGGFYKENKLTKNPATTNERMVNRLTSQSDRFAQAGPCFDIVGTPQFLEVYPPDNASGNYRLYFTPDAPTLDTGTPLDATMSKWKRFIILSVACFIHRKRGKAQDAALLAGDEANPQPGTLAHIRKHLQLMARNKLHAPQKVPLPANYRRGLMFDDGSDLP